MSEITQGVNRFTGFLRTSTAPFLQYVGSIYHFLLTVLYWIFLGPFRQKPIKREHLFEQIVIMGLGSIPIVMLTSLFLGMTLAMLGAYTLAPFGGEIYITTLVGIGFTRELGPLLTAIVIAGRVGASIAAELGTMKISEEIDALETMGINPIRFLVAPRFLALLIVLPCLTIISDYVGIIGGGLIAYFKVAIDPYYYKHLTTEALVLKDIVTGLIKSVFFAGIISMIGCFQGFIVKGGAEGVGRFTTDSVVFSLILIILSDCFFTALFSYVL